MLKIYACDDNTQQLSKIQNYIEKTILIEDYDLHLELVTTNPYHLLQIIPDNSVDTGLYFLDIDLNTEINGLELAGSIRKKDPRGFIVFITTHSEMSYLTFTYKVEALDFIYKEDTTNLSNRIHQCICYAYQKYSSPLNTTHKTFCFLIGEQEYCIPLENIVFFETSENPHKVLLHETNRILEFTGKLSSILQQLDDRFFQSHRSFLVNKDHIQSINKKERILYMDNNESCLASAKQLKYLLNKSL